MTPKSFTVLSLVVKLMPFIGLTIIASVLFKFRTKNLEAIKMFMSVMHAKLHAKLHAMSEKKKEGDLQSIPDHKNSCWWTIFPEIWLAASF